MNISRKMLKSFRTYLATLNLLDYEELKTCISSDLVWDDGPIRRNPASYEIFASHEHLDFAKEDIFKFSGIVLDLNAFESAAEKVEEIWQRRLPQLFPGNEFIIYKDKDHKQVAFCRKRIAITDDPDEIISYLDDDHHFIRWNAMLSATIFPHPRLTPYLIQRLDDSNVYNRLKAIIALGAQADPQALDPIRERFFRVEQGPDGKLFVDDFFAYDLFHTLLKLGNQGYELVFSLFADFEKLDMHTLEHLCELLGGSGKPEVLEILVAIYYHHPEVSDSALTGLLKMAELALPVMVARLNDPDPELRRKAMWFLANCYSRESRPYLVQGLRDKSSLVREAAVHGIGRFYSPTRKKLLVAALGDRATNVRVKAIEVLGSLFDRSLIPKFQELCSDKNQRVRHEAMRAIAALDSPGGIKFLTDLYDRSTNPDRVRIIDSLYAYTGKPIWLKPLVSKALASGNKRLIKETTDLLEILQA